MSNFYPAIPTDQYSPYIIKAVLQDYGVMEYFLFKSDVFTYQYPYGAGMCDLKYAKGNFYSYQYSEDVDPIWNLNQTGNMTVDLAIGNVVEANVDILDGNGYYIYKVATTIKYTLTTQTTVGGTITRSINPDVDGKYAENSSIVLTATPNSGYRFVSWSGDATGTEPLKSIVMTTNKTVVANFELIPPSKYTLTTQATVGGTITKSIDPDLDGKYTENTSITLTAVPNEGYEFKGWFEDLTSLTNPQTIVMTGNKSVLALFDLIEIPPSEYILTTQTTIGGTITRSIEPNTDGKYLENTSLVLTAIPNEGYKFVSWTGDLIGSEPLKSVVMTGNKSVIATFELIEVPIIKYSLKTQTTEGGTLTRSSEPDTDGKYLENTSIILTAVPSDGFYFSGWLGDLSGSTNPQTIILNKDMTIISTFEEIIVEVTSTIELGKIENVSDEYGLGTKATFIKTGEIKGYIDKISGQESVWLGNRFDNSATHIFINDEEQIQMSINDMIRYKNKYWKILDVDYPLDEQQTEAILQQWEGDFNAI
jgi:phosphatidylserine decarboxylase